MAAVPVSDGATILPIASTQRDTGHDRTFS